METQGVSAEGAMSRLRERVEIVTLTYRGRYGVRTCKTQKGTETTAPPKGGRRRLGMAPSKVIIKSTLTDDAPRARRWLTKVSSPARARGTGWRRLDGPGAWRQPAGGRTVQWTRARRA